ncbi:MAG: PP2C family protein-serine/threonine phosphatase [Pyrinomonadaceae bacterium]
MDSAQMIRSTPTVFDAAVQEELLGRLQRLRDVSLENGRASDLATFLKEVDTAIAKFEEGTYGICEECHESMNVETMLADPLARICLDELTGKQKTALEDDLEFAAQIQRGLLPERDISHGAWRVDYVYEPAQLISGDYCDVIVEDGSLYFLLGDVSGKGMAASLLMSNLHAIFHSLVPLKLELSELMVRANRLLLKSSLANQFATLVVGRASSDGEVETVNAGHLPPFVIKNGVKSELNHAGLPLGMFCEAEFESQMVQLQSGDSLLLYTDGVTETSNADGTEFGAQRLGDTVKGFPVAGPGELIARCLEHVVEFRGSAERKDDLSILALSYV